MVNKMKYEFTEMTRGELIAAIVNLQNEIKSLKVAEIELFGKYTRLIEKNNDDESRRRRGIK